MPAGRPTLYRPEMCEEVIPLLATGASIEEIGLELGCGYSTVKQWMAEKPEFADAIKRGRELSHGWWCKQGTKNLENKEFSATLWYMNMKNRFGWKDKTETDMNLAQKENVDRITREAEEEIKR